MKLTVAVIVTLAFPMLGRQDERAGRIVELTSRTVGHLLPDERPMPVGLDKGAKGPADVVRFTVGDGGTFLNALVDCDTCHARLVLIHNESKKTIAKADGYTASFEKALNGGTYDLWIGSGEGQSGGYELALTVGTTKPTSKIKQFATELRFFEGEKLKKMDVAMRFGAEAIAFVRVAGQSGRMLMGDSIVRAVRYEDITGLSTAAVSRYDIVFGGHTQENKFTIKTKSDDIVVLPPGQYYDFIGSELERRAKVKIER